MATMTMTMAIPMRTIPAGRSIWTLNSEQRGESSMPVPALTLRAIDTGRRAFRTPSTCAAEPRPRWQRQTRRLRRQQQQQRKQQPPPPARPATTESRASARWTASSACRSTARPTCRVERWTPARQCPWLVSTIFPIGSPTLTPLCRALSYRATTMMTTATTPATTITTATATATATTIVTKMYYRTKSRSRMPRIRRRVYR
mmetsp:Transcript_17993/g.37406  ORF Transcript_17993/g.37406 Transcript_17993/m.37406 type:complete len:202 (-) Transcript_17993:136-741(-)